MGGDGGLRPLGMGREDQGRAGSVFLQLGVQVCLSVLTTVRTTVVPLSLRKSVFCLCPCEISKQVLRWNPVYH